MVTERLASQCLTYFIDSKVEIAASSACRMICGISPRCQLAFQNPGAGLTIVWFLWVFLGCLFFQHLPGWCVCGPLVAQHSTDRSHLYPRLMAKRGPKAGCTGIFPPSLASNNTFTEQACWPAGPNCWATLLCFGLFVKQRTLFQGKSQWRDMAAPAQGPPGTAGSPQRRAGLCVGRARGSPHGPMAEECTACFNISFQFTAATLGRGGLQCRRSVTSHAFLPIAVLRQQLCTGFLL